MKEEFDVHITKKLKADVIHQAIKVAEENTITGYTVEELNQLSILKIVQKVYRDYGVQILRKKKRKSVIVQEAIDISNKK